MAHGQLRHGVGGGPGGVLHGNTGLLGVFNINVVHAHAAADNELEHAALGLVDVVGPDLGGAADHHSVELPQGRAQLLGGIEALHHLVSVGLQLVQGGFIHPVSNKDSHNNLLPSKFIQVCFCQ